MAGIKISSLPAAASAQLTDVFPADQTGPITRKIALSQVATLFNGNYVQLNPAGIQTISTYGLVTTSITGGNLELTGNTLSSINSNGNINIIPNGSGVTLFDSSTLVSNFTSIIGSQIIQMAKASSDANCMLGAYTNDNLASAYSLFKSRATTVGSQTTVQTNDILGNYQWWADDGTNFIRCGQIQVSAVNTISTGIIPTKMVFSTTNTSGALLSSIVIDEAQVTNLLHPLPVTSGGLGVASPTIHGILIGEGGSPVTPIVLTAGQILVGTTASDPAATSIVSGTGITVTNSSGSITVSANGSGLSWSTVAGTTQAAAIDNGYISGNAGQTTITLPATAAIGAAVGVEGLGAAGWILAANTGQTIKLGTGTTTSAGSLTSAAASDNVYVTCIVANTTWRVRTTNSAGLTIA